MSSELQKAKNEVARWETKVSGLKAQLASTEAELARDAPEISQFYLEGKDASALTERAGRNEVRRRGLEGALQLATASYSQAVAEVKRIEKEIATTEALAVRDAVKAMVVGMLKEMNATLADISKAMALQSDLIKFNHSHGLNIDTGMSLDPVQISIYQLCQTLEATLGRDLAATGIVPVSERLGEIFRQERRSRS